MAEESDSLTMAPESALEDTRLSPRGPNRSESRRGVGRRPREAPRTRLRRSGAGCSEAAFADPPVPPVPTPADSDRGLSAAFTTKLSPMDPSDEASLALGAGKAP